MTNSPETFEREVAQLVGDLQPQFSRFIRALSAARGGRLRARSGTRVKEVVPVLSSLVGTLSPAAAAWFALFDGFDGVVDEFIYGATYPLRFADVVPAYQDGCEGREHFSGMVPIAVSGASDLWAVDVDGRIWYADYEMDPKIIAISVSSLFIIFSVAYEQGLIRWPDDRREIAPSIAEVLRTVDGSGTYWSTMR